MDGDPGKRFLHNYFITVKLYQKRVSAISD